MFARCDGPALCAAAGTPSRAKISAPHSARSPKPAAGEAVQRGFLSSSGRRSPPSGGVCACGCWFAVCARGSGLGEAEPRAPGAGREATLTSKGSDDARFRRGAIPRGGGSAPPATLLRCLGVGGGVVVVVVVVRRGPWGCRSGRTAGGGGGGVLGPRSCMPSGCASGGACISSRRRPGAAECSSAHRSRTRRAAARCSTSRSRRASRAACRRVRAFHSRRLTCPGRLVPSRRASRCSISTGPSRYRLFDGSRYRDPSLIST